ncbi:MAG: HD domain-containing protein [Candidatus Omnitrophica bacterium]|nr:HD domain-containing protein [Candidatus Omnitrophota bacterium]
MRAAVIDVGSSSIKLIVGELHNDEIRIIESLRNVVPIGKHTFLKGRIPQGIINQTISVLERYKQTLQELDVKDFTVIATTAVREARNRDIFLDTVYRKTGFKVDVLNVGDVVYYTDSFLSHSSKIKKAYPIREKNLLIGELGAGSLDISVMEKGNTLMNIGFPIGTLRLAQFMAGLDGSMEEIYDAVEEYIAHEIKYLQQMSPKLNVDDVILIDENYSVFLQNILPNKRRDSNFFQFKKAESDEFLARLRERSAVEIARDYKIPVEISETIVGYAAILNSLFKLTNKENIYILETSLSEAILANMLDKYETVDKNNKLEQLISVATYLCRKFNLDLKHMGHVAELSKTLFHEFKTSLGLQETDLQYLILSAYLHDIGMFINNRAHHKHTEYVINSLNLFRLTEDEIKIIAAVARYHRKSSPLTTHLIYNSLSSAQQILVQKLSAILRIANALDRSHRQKVKRLEVKFSKTEDIQLIVYTHEGFLLEKSSFMEKKGFFEEITGNRLVLTVRQEEVS